MPKLISLIDPHAVDHIVPVLSDDVEPVIDDLGLRAMFVDLQLIDRHHVVSVNGGHALMEHAERGCAATLHGMAQRVAQGSGVTGVEVAHDELFCEVLGPASGKVRIARAPMNSGQSAAVRIILPHISPDLSNL